MASLTTLSDSDLLQETSVRRNAALLASNTKNDIEKHLDDEQREINSLGGMGQRLVDSDGFPRDDIDVLKYRTHAQELSRASHDHRDCLGDVAKQLNSYHDALREIKRRGLTPPSASINPVQSHENDVMKEDSKNIKNTVNTETVNLMSRIDYKPFAIIDEVAENSPAHNAGLLTGDEVVQFGNVIKSTNAPLQSIGALVQENIGFEVSLKVLRKGNLKQINVKPAAWSGRGLLGCHLKPSSC